MMVDKKRLSSSLDRQARWAESLWDEIGNLWADRKGQDHVYREQVTSKFLMVAITNHILKHNLRSWQLVDLGCGDGIPTSKLIMKLNELSSNCESEISILPDSILLIDRSQPLLSAASQNIDRVLHQSTTMSSDRQDTSKFKNLLSRRRLSCSAFAIDLVTDYLDSHIDGTKSNIFISEFVLQELPSLSNLFSSLSVTLNKDSLAIFIIPHPVFANQLLNDKRIPSAHIAAPGDACDWEWCGEYPVPNGRTMLYLPHFQRSLDLIREKGSEHKLHIEFEDMYLSHAILDCDSPNTNFASIEQLRVAYGSSIIDLPSSCALMVSHKSSEVS